MRQTFVIFRLDHSLLLSFSQSLNLSISSHLDFHLFPFSLQFSHFLHRQLDKKRKVSWEQFVTCYFNSETRRLSNAKHYHHSDLTVSSPLGSRAV